jgi:outer membrane protein TolC
MRIQLIALISALLVPSAALAAEPLTFEQALQAVDELEALQQQANAAATALDAQAEATDRLPGPSVGVEWADIRTHEREVGIGFAQPIPLNGAPGLTADALRHDADAAGMRGEVVVQHYKAEVARAFFEALYRENRLIVLDDRITAVERSREVLRRREAAGDASQFEVERVEREVRRLEVARATEEADLAAAREHLGALIRRDAPDPDGKLGVSTCGGEAAKSPQIAALEADGQAAESRAELADGAWIPTLEVEVGGMLMAEPGESFQPGYRVGFGFAFPFWGSADPLREAAEARASSISAERRIEEDLMQRQAKALTRRCTALVANAEKIESAIPKTRKLLERAEAGYGAGELSLLALLDAQQAVLDERLDLLDAKWSARRAQNQWLTRVGGWR